MKWFSKLGNRGSIVAGITEQTSLGSTKRKVKPQFSAVDYFPEDDRYLHWYRVHWKGRPIGKSILPNMDTSLQRRVYQHSDGDLLNITYCDLDADFMTETSRSKTTLRLTAMFGWSQGTYIDLDPELCILSALEMEIKMLTELFDWIGVDGDAAGVPTIDTDEVEGRVRALVDASVKVKRKFSQEDLQLPDQIKSEIEEHLNSAKEEVIQLHGYRDSIEAMRDRVITARTDRVSQSVSDDLHSLRQHSAVSDISSSTMRGFRKVIDDM